MLNENEILVIDFEGFEYNILIVKELSVHSKNYQETLLFKPPQAFLQFQLLTATRYYF